MPDEARTVILIGDSWGHEVSLHAEVLCVAQYLAQHAAVLALLRAQGTRLVGLLSGVGHSAAEERPDQVNELLLEFLKQLER